MSPTTKRVAARPAMAQALTHGDCCAVVLPTQMPCEAAPANALLWQYSGAERSGSRCFVFTHGSMGGRCGFSSRATTELLCLLPLAVCRCPGGDTAALSACRDDRIKDYVLRVIRAPARLRWTFPRACRSLLHRRPGRDGGWCGTDAGASATAPREPPHGPLDGAARASLRGGDLGHDGVDVVAAAAPGGLSTAATTGGTTHGAPHFDSDLLANYGLQYTPMGIILTRDLRNPSQWTFV